MTAPDLLITTTEAAVLHDVTRATIRRWVKHGWLTPAGRTTDGRNLYRVADVDRAEATARANAHGGRAHTRTRI